ncbi:MAG: DegT/DnrJ/EryC1/StrS family aminotransferase [Lachnospiraceae bacterium]|nr:DegT/DnrJ/EryC1/StrS family aminotransferase [Lachnospiraceae bacterium]
MPPYEEFIEAIRPLWESAWLTNMGCFHQELEARLTEYLQVPRMKLFVNGHQALEMTLQAMELRGEVITTPFSFASTTHAIVRNGLTPVFCDINSEDYTLDATKLEERITEKTSAIVPVHVYGNLCQVEEIERIAKKHGLKVIYDAAHAFGVKRNGVGVGNFGDASMFSFHATKVFHTIEGGGVAFSEESLGTRLDYLKNFGIVDKETVKYAGGNAKMNEFQAVMGLCNLRRLDGEIAKRKRVAARYRERLSGVPGIRLTRPQEGVTGNYAYFPVIFDGYSAGRDEIYDRLAAAGIGARKYFYPLINRYDCYRAQYDYRETPVAAYLADRVLTLPCYAELEEIEVDRICDVILGEQE